MSDFIRQVGGEWRWEELERALLISVALAPS